MTSAGFEPTISASERPQSYALDRAATGTGAFVCISRNEVHKVRTRQRNGLYFVAEMTARY